MPNPGNMESHKSRGHFDHFDLSTSALLERRQLITKRIESDAFSIPLHMYRAAVYAALDFPDLAVMDMYKVLLLTDEILDESGEYHSKASRSAQESIISGFQIENLAESEMVLTHLAACEHLIALVSLDSRETSPAELEEWTDSVRLLARVFLARNLRIIGCLRSALEYVQSALADRSHLAVAIRERDRILEKATTHFASGGIQWSLEEFGVKSLPDCGHVRRVIYPWNHHDDHRMSTECLEHLDREMRAVAPKLEVKLTNLPVLSRDSVHVNDSSHSHPVNVQQLGVFAREDLVPGEQILCERSMLTANARMHEPLCDACSVALPNLQTDSVSDEDLYCSTVENGATEAGPTPCPKCDDIVFCSPKCCELAQSTYHRATCGAEVEDIAKDVEPAKAADALYTQLLFRSLAMAQTQDIHPLDLKEVKYVWGDFDPLAEAHPNSNSGDPNSLHDSTLNLPFDFQFNIVQPLHFLEQMEVSIFGAPHDLSEVWVYNTLFAKFRGTASARISPRDGRPEVAAVHPSWCLANHACDPNVQWEWAGEITFSVREKSIQWSKRLKGESNVTGKSCRQGGIKSGEEIRNHYVDIDLPVDERRKWGVGALGGSCQCERCLWESTE